MMDDLQKQAELLRQKLNQAPNSPAAHNNLALVLRRLGQTSESEALLRKASALNPNSPDIAFNLGLVLLDEKRNEEAESAFRRALELRPGYAEASLVLGALTKSSGRVVESEALLRVAIAGLPHSVNAHESLGDVLRLLGRCDEAEAELRQALSLNPASFEANISLGLVLYALNRLPEAEAAARQSLALRPGSVRARLMLGLTLLKDGKYKDGLMNFESRYEESPEWEAAGAVSPYVQASRIPIAMWRGESLEGKSLVIAPEQGLGDAIQCIRFVPLLRRLGVSKLTVVCDAALMRLFSLVDGVDAVSDVSHPQELSGCDFWCYMMSLPHRLGITLDMLHSNGRYIDVPEENVQFWKQRINASLTNGRYKIGLAWSGSNDLGNPSSVLPPELRDNIRRSVRLQQLLPLLRISQCTFFSLQKGGEERQLAEIPEAVRPLDLMSNVTDFLDTAAIIENLDLVITVDTSVAHLAGALGKPVWILSRFDGDWRWLLDREDSPWYASARVFTQKTRGDWDEVIAGVKERLTALCSGLSG
ncbi:tetratricopeptide repeat protein [Caballeronia sp. LP006]|uniref:tetratricopeptide repeat-containing glycosyltransferase family protein n=1 Tax=Caballeronia sp. LP006 TaxID=3038552 RepID=UPI0028667729|nr:tetratricopeptide repeat protein [Caballeronia sp. LP006]MDR5827321.1 tetratricopeptide repeat protein [Caballeronia sp. LP006]